MMPMISGFELVLLSDRSSASSPVNTAKASTVQTTRAPCSAMSPVNTSTMARIATTVSMTTPVKRAGCSPMI